MVLLTSAISLKAEIALFYHLHHRHKFDNKFRSLKKKYVTATALHGLHHTTKTAKIQRGAITFATRRYNVNVHISDGTFLIFALGRSTCIYTCSAFYASSCIQLWFASVYGFVK